LAVPKIPCSMGFTSSKIKINATFLITKKTKLIDIAELDNEQGTETVFPNPNDLTDFRVYITPQDGYWKGAKYEFSFQIPEHYPHSPPKIHCKTQIYHPNIDLEGKVCLNILREKWTPVLDLSQVIFGLIHIFIEPNPKDPLNHEAAELLRRDPEQFSRLVARTLRGGRLDNVQFPRLL